MLMLLVFYRDHDISDSVQNSLHYWGTKMIKNFKILEHYLYGGYHCFVKSVGEKRHSKLKWQIKYTICRLKLRYHTGKL